MRADHMAVLSQRQDLVLGEEAGLADIIRRDQEVAAPSVPGQDLRDHGVGTDASIIERQHQWFTPFDAAIASKTVTGLPW